jgi:hypothetical protein
VATVLIVGTGDMGERFALGLASSGRVRRLVLVDRPGSALGAAAATVASVAETAVRAEELDARRQDVVEDLLRRTRPDLVVQVASTQSPWALVGRDDPTARALSEAGLGIRLPFQLPVLLAVMRAAREIGYAGPIANLSLPDLTHPVLDRLGLAPTVGLGNAGMLLLRARAALAVDDQPSPSLVRVVGHHNHVYGVMQAQEPADGADRCRVYVGEAGERDDGAPYRLPGIAPTIRYNVVTAAAALPVLLALLPGAEPLRWSTPAPFGLPGGYPVRIADGRVELDLPAAADRDEAIAFNERIGRNDGVERIDADGTVHFTEQARAAVAPVAPDLGEPLRVDEIEARAQRIASLLTR